MKVCVNEAPVVPQQQRVPWVSLAPGQFFGIADSTYVRTRTGCIRISEQYSSGADWHVTEARSDNTTKTDWVGEGTINITKVLAPAGQTSC